MGMTAIMTRNDGEDFREYKKALKQLKKATEMAAEATDIICDLSEEMEDEYADGGSSATKTRSSSSMRRRMHRKSREDWDDEY